MTQYALFGVLFILIYQRYSSFATFVPKKRVNRNQFTFSVSYPFATNLQFSTYFCNRKERSDRMKIKVPDNHCKGCTWLVNSSVCSFERCIRYFGWETDKKRNKEK